MAAKQTTAETETEQEAPGSLEQAIRLRAYEISQSADAGTPEQNWERAERELSEPS